MSDVPKDPQDVAGEEQTAPVQQQAQRQQIEVDTDTTFAAYANFCRVTGTLEELIVDFGLNPQLVGPTSQPVKISQRIILNYYTAKRLFGALSLSIQRHEQAFGVLEIDVNKRVQQPGT